MTERARGERIAAESSFTLVEILVAMAVFGILLVFLFSFTFQINKVWQHGLAEIEGRQNDRALLDFIAIELQCATVGVPISGTNSAVQVSWGGMTTNLPPYQFVINPTGIGATNAQAIFWQAPIATVTANGNLAEVGYCVSWSSSTSGGNSACLRRFFLNPPAPSDTVDASVYNSPTAWITQARLDSIAPADAANQYRGLFAENVYALWVRALDSYGNAIGTNAAGALYPPYAYDSRQGYIDSQGGIHPPPSLPAMVEVALVSANARTTRLLTSSYPAGASATSPANFEADISNYVASFPQPVRAALHVYSTRIVLSNAH